MDAKVAANIAAKDMHTKNMIAEYDGKIRALTNQVLGGQDKEFTTHLSVAMQALVKLLLPSIPNAIPSDQAATALLTGYAQTFIQVQQLMAERDAKIASFELPFPESGLE